MANAPGTTLTIVNRACDGNNTSTVTGSLGSNPPKCRMFGGWKLLNPANNSLSKLKPLSSLTEICAPIGVLGEPVPDALPSAKTRMYSFAF